MAPSEERAEALWFTDPYYYHTASFAVHVNNVTIRTADDLAGKRIGVGTGTIYEAYLHGELVMLGGEIAYDPPQVGEIVAYTADQEAIMDLALGDGIRLDAVMTSQRTIRGAIEERVPLKEVLPPAFYEGMVFALDKSRGSSDRLITELNRIIAEMRADRTLSRLSIEWFGADYSVPAASVPAPPPIGEPTEHVP
jgi:polar amino acid transport system substrate-binding protein